MKKRKGAMHALEALLAFSIVSMFILFVTPSINISELNGHKTNYVYSTLETLETKGLLRSYASENNLTGLNTTLADLLPETYNFAVGISRLNATHKTISGNHSANYSADTTKLDYITLDLIFDTATDPNIYLNDALIYSQTGDASGVLDSIDLTTSTVSGENSLVFNFTGSSTFDYRLSISESEDLSTPPSQKDIDTVNYFISGIDSTFRPTIVRVYLW
ncbi:MAG: hypothetical protein KAI18_03775 [Candidatus Aenigmarchaeota archaeon]|nr:hypothetical protein [Candidatus Aenigmarchaeota archaeon]